MIICGLVGECTAKIRGISFLPALIKAGILAIALLVTWGVSKIFGVDFFITYQIMTFGQCLLNVLKKYEHSRKKDRSELFLVDFFVF